MHAFEDAIVDEAGQGPIAVGGLGAKKRIELTLRKHDEAAELVHGQAEPLVEVDPDLLGLAHGRGRVVVDDQGLSSALGGGAGAARLESLVGRIAGDGVAQAIDAERERHLGGLVRGAQVTAQAAGVGLGSRQ